MKELVTTSFQELLKHRFLTVLLGVFTAVSALAVVYVAITLQASELRIVTHYTAFGVTHFYRDQWLYLIGFAAFCVVSFVIGLAVALKLVQAERVSLALFWVWAQLFIVIFTVITYTHLAEFA